MKNIKFLFLLVATLFVGAFTSCQQEEDWAPGQPDSELSVYFPVDVNVAEFASVDSDDTVEIDETTTALFPVYRPIAGEKMTVEIRSRIVNPDAVVYRKFDSNGKLLYEVNAAEAFIIAESITFKADETLTYLQIDLNEKVESLSVGSLFEIEIMVKDSAHHGSYGLYRKTLSVGIPETWKDLGDDYKDADLKKGTYRDDFFAPLYAQPAGNVVSIVIEESESRKGVLRMKNVFSQDNMVAIIGGTPSDMSFASGDTYILIDARKPDSVYIPFQSTGVGIPGYMDNIGIASGASINAENAVLENGTINFAANTVGLLDYNTGAGMYANQSGLMRITLPGVSIKDYALSVAFTGTQSSPDNSETIANFDFAVGSDVKNYRFVVVEGNVPSFEQVKEGSGLNQTFKNVPHEAIKQIVAATANADGSLVLPEDYVIPEGEESYVENAAESPASETSWYITMPEPEIYTLFAVAYDENGEVVVDDAGQYKVARVHFYYHPSNMNHGDQVPDIAPMQLTFGSLSSVIGSRPDLEPLYPAAFVLFLDMKCKDADLLSKIMFYYAKTSELPEGWTAESVLKTAEVTDYSSWIPDVEAGKAQMTLNSLTPDTEYTAFVSVTSIYGKTYYYSVSGKTAPYTFDVAVGVYELTEGDNKIKFELVPFFANNYMDDPYCGELYYVNWLLDENSPYAEVEKYSMVAFRMPAYNAIVCYGQVFGYSGTFFAYDFPYLDYDSENKATTNPDKVWGFESSSEADYEFNYESMVLYYDEDGVVEGLGTYFRQYLRETTITTDENGEEKTEVKTTYPLVFTPDATVTCVENKKPVIEDTEEVQPTPEQQAMKLGVSNVKRHAKLTVNKNLVFDAVSVQ